MPLKTTLNYSPCFNPKKRNIKQIKFIIFHYTGMRKESEAINRLTSIQSEVSCHYLIKKSGEIIKVVPDLYVAWHAGRSSWGKFKSLNQNSIGIEITNPGHEHGYKKFSKKQIFSLLKISKFLIKKYNISHNNILGHSDISPDRKKDPGEKFPWKYLSKNKIGLWHTLKNRELIKNRRIKTSNTDKKFFFDNLFKIGYSKKTLKTLKTLKNLNKERYLRDLTKNFQRRYRQDLIDGKIDRECLLISTNFLKRHNSNFS